MRDEPATTSGAPLPFVRVGEPMRFVEELEAQRSWPPSEVTPEPNEAPTATPYLVIRADANDFGARPLPGPEATRSQSIQVVDASGGPTLSPQPGESYELSCQVFNHGATAAYGGLADFYVQPAAALDGAVGAKPTSLPAHGRTGFVVQPGETVTVESPHPWTPTTDAEMSASVLVHAYDFLLDGITSPFDARNDRHVGRLDRLPEFAGVWDGLQRIVGDPSGQTYLYRVIITQSGVSVTAAFHSQVSGALPSVPQDSASGTIVAGGVSLTNVTLLSGAAPFAENHWELTLPAADLLHVEHHRRYIMPGDTRPDQDLVADLARI